MPRRQHDRSTEKVSAMAAPTTTVAGAPVTSAPQVHRERASRPVIPSQVTGVSHLSDLATEPAAAPSGDVEVAAGDAAVAATGVLVERWAKEPLLERVGAHLAGPSGPALAIGSINIDHFHHFGEGRIELPNDPGATGVDWLMLADGAPVAARAAMVAKVTWPRLTGADLLPDLLAISLGVGAKVGFLGGAPDVHARLREVLAQTYPDLDVQFWAPERAEVDSVEGSTELAAQVAESGVQMLVVALGKPRQELWIQEYGAATGASVLLAFGASADFMAGKVSRAPDWVQSAGLEWAYRLSREPKRLARRYLIQGPPAFARLLPARKV